MTILRLVFRRIARLPSMRRRWPKARGAEDLPEGYLHQSWNTFEEELSDVCVVPKFE